MLQLIKSRQTLINGKYLINKGYQPGIKIGQIIKKTLKTQLNNIFKNKNDVSYSLKNNFFSKL